MLPDNVGPTGKVGECMPNNQWWGGYYGYRWPHGIMNSQESILVAGSNAFMLTADPASFDLYRAQTDLIWSLGKVEDGVWKIPNRHSDNGWCDFKQPSAVAGFERNRVLVGRRCAVRSNPANQHHRIFSMMLMLMPSRYRGSSGYPVLV